MDGTISRPLCAPRPGAVPNGASDQATAAPQAPRQPQPAMPHGEPSLPLGGQRPVRTSIPRRIPQSQLVATPVDTPREIHGYVAMPADVLRQVAGFLSPKEVSNMAQTNRATHEALHNLRVKAGSQQVATPADLQRSLQQITGLPIKDQAEPLRQLMLRLHALPLGSRLEALSDCRAAIGQIPTEHRPAELPRLRAILRYRTADMAVLHGEHVGHVSACFDITAPARIERLETLAIGSLLPNTAGTRILRGGNVLHVAREFGITTPEGIRCLEESSIYGNHPSSAGARVRRGVNVQRVAQDHGITTPDGIRSLEDLSIDSDQPNTAGTRVRQGENVRDVAQELGITTPAGIRNLEDESIGSVQRGTAGARIRQGENVRHVARELGITTPVGIVRLEARSIMSIQPNTAGVRVRQGENVQDVARELGITTPDGISHLESESRRPVR